MNQAKSGRRRPARNGAATATPSASHQPFIERWPSIAMAGLCVLTLIAYWNSFSAGFALDNRQLILQDSRVHDATAANVGLILRHSYWWPYGESGLYRPITTLSYLFNYAVVGNAARPFGYHVVNLLLHEINVALAFLLARRLARSTWVATAAVALWAVHPLSTEAVTNIVGRADLLAGLSVLGGVVAYTRARDGVGGARYGWLAALLVAGLIGVFSKETAVALAGVIVAFEVALWRPGRSPAALLHGAIALLVPLLALWRARAVALAAGPIAEFPFIDNPIVAADFWTARATALAVGGRYLALLTWPARLSSDYSFAQVPLLNSRLVPWIVLLGLGAIVLLAVWWFRTARAAFLFGALAMLTWLPASNLLFTSGTIMAERLMYLPALGIIGSLLMIGSAAIRRSAVATPVVFVLFAVAVVGLTGRTWIRNRDWRNDVTLWSSAVSSAPRSAKAHRALAEALYDADPTRANLATVVAEAETAVALLSDVPDRLNDPPTFRQAGAYYLDRAEVLRQDPSSAASQAGIWSAYQRAEALLTRAMGIIDAQAAGRPDASSAPKGDVSRLLAAAYLGLNDAPKALEAATRARTLDPLDVLGYRLTADALLAGRRADDAAVALMVGSMVTGNQILGADLIRLYQSGVDEGGCAVLPTPNGPALNTGCAMVQRHACAASAEAIAVDEHLGRGGAAADLRRAMAETLMCRP